VIASPLGRSLTPGMVSSGVVWCVWGEGTATGDSASEEVGDRATKGDADVLQDHRRTWTWGMRGVRTAGAALALAGLLAVGAAGSPSVVRAQDLATPEAAMAVGVPTVSVSGHGEVTVPPDTASVSIGIDVIQPTLGEAQAQATAQATAVIEALKAAGIADEDIQTAYFSLNILRDYDTAEAVAAAPESEIAAPAQITGFEIVNQLQVTVRDTDMLGELLDEAVNAGANSINGVTFYVDDQTAAASEARRLAVEDARTKTEELAAATGLTLGPVISIAEGTVSPLPRPMPAAADAGMAEAQAAVPVQPGSSTVAVDVSMTFELR
jgi:uncharacterized protein